MAISNEIKTTKISLKRMCPAGEYNRNINVPYIGMEEKLKEFFETYKNPAIDIAEQKERGLDKISFEDALTTKADDIIGYATGVFTAQTIDIVLFDSELEKRNITADDIINNYKVSITTLGQSTEGKKEWEIFKVVKLTIAKDYLK